MAQVSFQCDEITLQKFKGIVGFGRVSTVLREYMISTVNGPEEVLSSVDRDLLKIELEKEQKLAAEHAEKVKNAQKNMAKIEEKVAQNAENILKTQKIFLENAKRCLKCGNFLEGHSKKYQFAQGFVCNSCFFSAKPEDVQKWEAD